MHVSMGDCMRCCCVSQQSGGARRGAQGIWVACGAGCAPTSLRCVFASHSLFCVTDSASLWERPTPAALAAREAQARRPPLRGRERRKQALSLDQALRGHAEALAVPAASRAERRRPRPRYQYPRRSTGRARQGGAQGAAGGGRCALPAGARQAVAAVPAQARGSFVYWAARFEPRLIARVSAFKPSLETCRC